MSIIKQIKYLHDDLYHRFFFILESLFGITNFTSAGAYRC